MISSKPIIDTIIKKSPHLEWMRFGLLYHCQHGSRAYNTHLETSDYDTKGVVVPSHKYFFGFQNSFEQAELKDPDPDCTIYNVIKFFNLAATSANPNLIELLFVKPEHHLFVHEAWEHVLDNRELFLSKKIRWSMGGFAHANWKKAKRHYQWLTNPKEMPPTRKESGLPDKPEMGQENLNASMAAVEKELDKYNFNFLHNLTKDERYALKETVVQMMSDMKIYSDQDQFTICARKIGLDDNLIEILQKEREYNTKVEDFRKYQGWQEERNASRAILESKYGYDSKAIYHVYRLYNCAIEVLETGKLNVWRDDRELLMEVRQGKPTFDEVEEFVKYSDEKLTSLYKTSNILPNSPDLSKLDRICQNVVERILK